MKVTGFAPLIVTRDADALVKVFEGLGFELLHTKKGIESGANTNYQLRNEKGFRVNVASSEQVEHDISAITINVDDFDEAYDYFIDHGFVNPRGDKVTYTGSSIGTMLFGPNGAAVTIAKHIVKE